MGKLIERYSFGKIKERGVMPHFLEFQINSYEDFLQTVKSPDKRSVEGLEQALQEVFPIESSNGGDIKLDYLWYELIPNDPPLNDELECKKRGKTYSASLKVRFRLWNKKTEEVQENLIYFGEVPLMTDRGTFIINGAERVVVSQLHRSPGVSFNKETYVQTGKDLFSGKIIPYKGTWLEFETDKNDYLNVKIDRKKKVLFSIFLKAIGFYETNREILDGFLETRTFEMKEYKTKYANREDLIEELRTKIEGSIIKEAIYRDWETDRKSTRLNSSHITRSRMPSSA